MELIKHTNPFTFSEIIIWCKYNYYENATYSDYSEGIKVPDASTTIMRIATYSDYSEGIKIPYLFVNLSILNYVILTLLLLNSYCSMNIK